ncbi:hypothetical protein IWX90DRAFT_494237 [Phyllosticta citrichinensis]|uniref:Uncharacterized protein n=1 Tax=Phyllosticta citrichinensis TaxID=1130410 RepID=A0ABR1XIT1_9PEZI
MDPTDFASFISLTLLPALAPIALDSYSSAIDAGFPSGHKLDRVHTWSAGGVEADEKKAFGAFLTQPRRPARRLTRRNHLRNQSVRPNLSMGAPYFVWALARPSRFRPSFYRRAMWWERNACHGNRKRACQGWVEDKDSLDLSGDSPLLRWHVSDISGVLRVSWIRECCDTSEGQKGREEAAEMFQKEASRPHMRHRPRTRSPASPSAGTTGNHRQPANQPSAGSTLPEVTTFPPSTLPLPPRMLDAPICAAHHVILPSPSPSPSPSPTLAKIKTPCQARLIMTRCHELKDFRSEPYQPPTTPANQHWARRSTRPAVVLGSALGPLGSTLFCSTGLTASNLCGVQTWRKPFLS